MGRAQTVCGNVVEENQRERRADHVQRLRIHRGVHRPPRQQQHQPRFFFLSFFFFFFHPFSFDYLFLF
jgi:hypothetical protein